MKDGNAVCDDSTMDDSLAAGRDCPLWYRNGAASVMSPRPQMCPKPHGHIVGGLRVSVRVFSAHAYTAVLCSVRCAACHCVRRSLPLPDPDLRQSTKSRRAHGGMSCVPPTDRRHLFAGLSAVQLSTLSTDTVRDDPCDAGRGASASAGPSSASSSQQRKPPAPCPCCHVRAHHHAESDETTT
jgi:hypothetical protein